MAVTAKSLGWQTPEGKNSLVGFGHYEDTINALEKALTPGTYICGEQFTAADVYIGASLGWGMMFGTIEKRSVFETYVGRLYTRLAFQKAQHINEAFLKASKQAQA